ncbi:MAG: rhamnulokinase family protein [Muribaculaceae bacterium]
MNYFAVDLGATSGRTMLCRVADGKITIEEVSRFINPIIEAQNHCYWDILHLYREIINGLATVARRGIDIASIGIDTWGVDFVCFGSDGAILSAPFSYRDPHTFGIPEKLFEEIPATRVYGKTGIQVMDFNSLFQLYAMHKAGNSALAAARKILFMPDALSYLLTGKMVTEYSIASTSQLLNPVTKELDDELLHAAGVSRDQFAPIVMPGTRVGVLTSEVQRLTGLGAVPVIAVAGHDTASAIAAVPARNDHFAYLSSGTWSLMGIETHSPIINEHSCCENFTNEGGVDGTTRFLKNICGMWLLERCRAEWKASSIDTDHALIAAEVAKARPFAALINPDAKCFANPASMLDAIAQYCGATSQPVPDGIGATARCIFESLALRYRQVMNILDVFAPMPIECLHIIGGGSRNATLNQFTCNSIGRRVIAGPAECTALGNAAMQARVAGEAHSLADMRALIAASVETVEYAPDADRKAWDDAYTRYIEINEIYNKQKYH